MAARTLSPFATALAGFDNAMAVAEKYRRELKTRFGFDDATIGRLVLARRGKARGPYGELAKATLAAKQRMGNG